MALAKFAIISLTLFLNASPGLSQKIPDVNCHKQPFQRLPEFFKHYHKCDSDMTKENQGKPFEDIKKTGMTCAIVCALTAEGLFNSEGRFQEAKLNVTVDKYVPSKYAKSLREEVTDCARKTKIYEAVNVPYDPVCNKVYKRFLRCLIYAHTKICTNEDPKAMDYSIVPNGK